MARGRPEGWDTMRAFRKLLRRKDRGQGLVEYSMILLLMTIAMLVMVTHTAGEITNLYSEIWSAVQPIIP